MLRVMYTHNSRVLLRQIKNVWGHWRIQLKFNLILLHSNKQPDNQKTQGDNMQIRRIPSLEEEI